MLWNGPRPGRRGRVRALEGEANHVVAIPSGYVIKSGGELRIYSGPNQLALVEAFRKRPELHQWHPDRSVVVVTVELDEVRLSIRAFLDDNVELDWCPVLELSLRTQCHPEPRLVAVEVATKPDRLGTGRLRPVLPVRDQKRARLGPGRVE